MTRALQWQPMAASELAQLLGRSQVRQSRALGDCTVYQLQLEGRDLVAVALPDGQALWVESVPMVRTNRRVSKSEK